MNVFTAKPYYDKEDVLLPKSRNNILLMHPLTIKTLELKKNSPVLIKTENGALLLKCWPLESLEKTVVALPAFSLFKHYITSSLAVIDYKGTVLHAGRVVLSPINYKTFMDSKAFKLFIRNKLVDSYLRKGMILHYKYMGYPCSFMVKTITSVINENINIANEILTKLPEECSVDAINDMDDSSFEKSFNEKCSLLNTFKNENHFQSSTPISTPKIESRAKPSNFSEDDIDALINNTDPEQFYNISSKTGFFIAHCKNVKDLKILHTTFEDIAGLDEQVNEVESIIKSILDQGNKPSSRGILMVGPSGVGKSLIIQALQNKFKDQLFIHVVEKDSFICANAVIPQLKIIFKDAKENSPSIIILEDINHLWKNGDFANITPQEKKLIAELSSMIYNLLNSINDAVVIGTCQNETLVPNNLQKHGILNTVIRFSIPSTTQRRQILCKLLKKFKNNLTTDQISEVSNMAHGFTGGDLKKLCSNAAKLSWLQRKEAPYETTVITFDDFAASLKFVKPSSVIEFSFEIPNVKWSDIGGMDEVKSTIKEMVEWPLKYPEKLKHFNIMVPRGILMYGPPGCCKTMMAKALATEGQLHFINVKSSQVFSKYVGDSEKSVSELFKKARSAAPCILFLDEIDSLAPKRGSSSGKSNVADRVLTQILVEIDGIDVLSEGVCIMAATNRPDNIDPSLLRPGRFDRLVYVPLPDVDTRRKIFEVLLLKKPISSDINFSYLVEKTENYTGAEISDVCSQACMLAIKEDTSSCSSVVTMSHLLKALLNVQPRTTKEMLESFKSYHDKKLSNSL